MQGKSKDAHAEGTVAHEVPVSHASHGDSAVYTQAQHASTAPQSDAVTQPKKAEHDDTESANDESAITTTQPQRSVVDFQVQHTTSGAGGDKEAAYSLPLSWRKLSYNVGKLSILIELTGTALPNRCLAIMGGSGAGKTTFLNAICDRLASGGKAKLTGLRQLGDAEYQRRYRKAIGFVTQDDIISSLATPTDAMAFSVRTRRGTTLAETRQRVNETLEVLRLVHCKNTIVGIPGLIAGLSGGERKRCNIGVELICDPKVLLLDEPTSGLDSVTSAKIINLLQQLSRVGRTVIYTIHQPTAEVLSFFDDIMLLAQGRCVYHGTMSNIAQYFESIGYVCPQNYTPTDYYMTLLQDTITSKILVKRWSKYLKNVPRTPHTVAIRVADSESESSAARYLDDYIKKFGSSPFTQFYEVAKRRAIELSRDTLYIFAVGIQAIFFAVMVGLIFLRLGKDVNGMTDTSGVLFMISMNRGMSPAFLMINSFHKTRAVYLREQRAGAYSPFIFFVGRFLAEFPLHIFFVVIESLILYWMLGLHASPGAFFYYFGVVALCSEVAVGLGFAISASASSLMLAGALAPLILVPLAMASGLFASTSRLRPYWYWLEKPSYTRQAYILLMRNELQHVDHVSCDYQRYGDFYCLNQYKNGKDVLLRLGFDNDPQSLTVYLWVTLAILWFLVRLICVVALSIVAREKT